MTADQHNVKIVSADTSRKFRAMPIKVTCGKCAKVMSAPDSSSGKRGKCPACGAAITIPSPTDTPVASNSLLDLLEESEKAVSATQVTQRSVSPAPRGAANALSGMDMQAIAQWSFLALLALGLSGFLVSYLNYLPADERNFGKITGILASANETVLHRKSNDFGLIEIRLRDSSVRYCVPEDGYLECFRREGFLATVRPGATMELYALKSDIENPSTFLLNSGPTVVVRGVSAGGITYCALADQIAWQNKNNQMKLVLVAAGAACLAVLAVALWRQKGFPWAPTKSPR